MHHEMNFMPMSPMSPMQSQIRDPCLQLSCLNGGMCQNQNGFAACLCLPKFFGERCQFGMLNFEFEIIVFFCICYFCIIFNGIFRKDQFFFELCHKIVYIYIYI